MKDIIDADIIQAPSPDHKAVKIKISLSKRKRGKGYWKMNSGIINKNNYNIMIKDLINHTKDKYLNVKWRGQFWEFLKLRIKEQNDIEKFTKEWGGKAFWSPGSSSSKGVALLINPKVDITLTIDDKGRYLLLRLNVIPVICM